MTILSSCFFFFLFVFYNTVQYFVINRWMYNQELSYIRQTSKEIKAYLEDTKSHITLSDIQTNNKFLASLSRNDQAIRILDEKGVPVFTQDNQINVNWDYSESEVNLVYNVFDVWHDTDHLLIIRERFSTEQLKGTIEIIRNLKKFDELTNEILFYFLLAGTFAVMLSAVGGYIISNQLVKPIKLMTSTMKEVRNDRRKGLDQRVNLYQNGDEISELADIFNEMMDRLEQSFQQQSQFVEDASHELRTPISIIEGHLALLNRWGKSDPQILDESLTLALHETKRLKSIVQELLELIRTEIQPTLKQLKPIDPVPIIKKIIHNLSILHPDNTIRLELFIHERSQILIKENHLEQIFLILLDNAIKYSPNNKLIEVTGSEISDRIQFIVKDSGHGIPKSDLPHIFDRFFRADKARNREKSGIGLGLSIAHRLISNYKGRIRVESTEGVGTSFTIQFPIAKQPTV